MTLKRFNTGLSTQEIADERGLSRVTIEGHLIRCADEGHELDWGRVIPEQYEEQIVHVVQELGPDKLRPIKDALPEEVDYFSIHGVIAKYGFKTKS